MSVNPSEIHFPKLMRDWRRSFLPSVHPFVCLRKVSKEYGTINHHRGTRTGFPWICSAIVWMFDELAVPFCLRGKTKPIDQDRERVCPQDSNWMDSWVRCEKMNKPNSFPSQLITKNVCVSWLHFLAGVQFLWLRSQSLLIHYSSIARHRCHNQNTPTILLLMEYNGTPVHSLTISFLFLCLLIEIGRNWTGLYSEL